MTKAFRDRIVELYDVEVDRTYIIPDGVDFAHISQGWNGAEVSRLRASWKAESGVVVMYVGSLDFLHGGEYLSQVIRKLLEDKIASKDIRIVVVGTGPLATSFAGLQRRFRGRVFFVPGISYSTLPSYLAAADVLLVPHPRNLLMDNIESGKLLIYLASGKPTVATRLNCVSRFLEDGVTSVLSDPDSPLAMVNGIKRLACSPDTRNRIGAQGALLVKEKRDWSSVARTCVDVYNDLIAR